MHTQIKIEEPHKRRDIIQCQNSQEYGHSRSYCAYPPRCVRCGQNHDSSDGQKPKDYLATFALCKNDHPANYKGSNIYKNFQRLHQPTSNHIIRSTPRSFTQTTAPLEVNHTDIEINTFLLCPNHFKSSKSH